MALVFSCSSQKDTVANRKLHNLSAKYNLIYNANLILGDYEEALHQRVKENFNSLLPLYHTPVMANVTTAGVKIAELEEIENKARTLIAEKNLSNYIDEAYMLLGKTNFYQGRYYNANAYFDYVAQAYKKDHGVYLNALNYKARSVMALGDLKTAAKILDTVKLELESVKKDKASPLATLAQFNIQSNNANEAISYLEKALKAKPTAADRTKWTYTLAQLYENERQFDESLAAYRKVEKSNAPFEMYFNAKLSKIRINEKLQGNNFDRRYQLVKMLKDDKNLDFRDQIYYEIAEDYYDKRDYLNADANYNLSVRNSTSNAVQKALSYLKLAELNFKDYNNYVDAKLYYDSTVIFLPKTHLLYEPISTKAKNLAYLKDRRETISLQDTLQKIAALPAEQRVNALMQYFAATTSNTGTTLTGMPSANLVNTTKTILNGVFYFSNAVALSKGYNEFKKKWGNRKLTSNWRQSVKSGAQNQQDAMDIADINVGDMPSDPDAVQPRQIGAPLNTTLYIDSIPLTPALLEQSNRKIINAYLEMGTFYQQVLKDKQETIKTYEQLLSRFPNNDKLAMIYYSLYLAYQGIDSNKGEGYKNLVLSKYPNSVFAKTIIDPSFSMKQNQLEAVLNTAYENVFNKLKQREFTVVIAEANDWSTRFPGNATEPQFDYLKAIAVGHTDNVTKLLSAFNEIINKYKDDKLITPLVKQHLIYINEHLGEFKKRKIALTRYDSNDVSFGESFGNGIRLNEPIIANLQNPTGNKKVGQLIMPAAANEEKPTPIAKPVKKAEAIVAPAAVKAEDVDVPVVAKKEIPLAKVNAIVKEKDTTIAAVSVKMDSVSVPLVVAKPKDTVAVVQPIPVKDDLFSPASSTNYYYVVAVNAVNVSVSSSRFGIGQFNRGNYAGANLRHQLKEFANDQLVIVGDFNSAAAVTEYAERIKAQLGVIMKIPAANYTTFAVSKENLEKITNSQTLERYIRYINSNEL